MTVLVALLLVVFLIMAAMALDFSNVQLAETQLRKAADAASHAAVEALVRTDDPQQARQAARDVAAANELLGASIQLADSDLVFGRTSYQNGSWQFTPNVPNPNAARVVLDPPAGVLSILGGVFGIDRYRPSQSSTASNLTRDICFVLDRSGSMAWDLTDVDWSYPDNLQYCDPPHPSLSRWAAVVNATQLFLQEIGKTPQIEIVGLATYASDVSICNMTVNAADIESPLTQDYAAVNGALTAIGMNPIPGGTNISAGIDRGVEVLTDPARARPFAEQMIVLLTDGVENAGRPSSQAAADAAHEGIVIHTITFSDGANQATMQQVAQLTGGKHFHAPDDTALAAIFLQIARGLPVVLTE